MTTLFSQIQTPEQTGNFESPLQQSNTPLINFDAIKKITIIGSTFGGFNNNYKIKKYQNESINIRKYTSKSNDKEGFLAKNKNEKINDIFYDLNKKFSELKEKRKNIKTNINDNNQFRLNHSINNNDCINKVWNYLGNNKSIKIDLKLMNNNNNTNDQTAQLQQNILLNSNNMNLTNNSFQNNFNSNNIVIHSNDSTKQSITSNNKTERHSLNYSNYQKQIENIQFINQFEHKNDQNEYQQKQMIYNNNNNNLFRIIPHVLNQNNNIDSYYNNHTSNNLNNFYYSSQHPIKLTINTSSSLLGKKIDRFHNSSSLSSDNRIKSERLLYNELQQ